MDGLTRAVEARAGVICADIGGTRARFAIARQGEDGSIGLSDIVRLEVAAHDSLEAAFRAFADAVDGPLPDVAGIAIAGPVEGAELRFANNPWIVRSASLAGQLGLGHVVLVNDFAAVAHAVSVCGKDALEPLGEPLGDTSAPLRPGLPADGWVTVIGPGTGLGVALLRTGNMPIVQATEAGHIGFAPHDTFEDRLLASLREDIGRVSVERVVSGPGLAAIARQLAHDAGTEWLGMPDAELWAAAIGDEGGPARAALDRWLRMLGSVAGDLLLAHGSQALVLAGGLAARASHLVAGSGFSRRLADKGRFSDHLASLPLFRLTHPEPGLLGAAIACLRATGR
ncbi:glucokinase [Sandaracinobacteroides sp. A072]|uniref:glucokinase n=1 Tax=Sandaracinobacteroides sp. A072 TaxID=3461146 RepID=UPI00404234F3